MNQSLVIGPLALQVAVLLALAAVSLGWFAAARMGRSKGLALDPQLYAVLAAGLLAARCGFVLQHAGVYAAAPLSVLDVRDGGWSAAFGFAGAAAVALLLALRRRALMKPLVAGLATAAAIWFGASVTLGLLEAAPARLPALALPALEGDGRPVALEQFTGKPVVLNLWATWCPPCIREMPVLQQAQQQRRDVHFVFVNQGERPERVRAFLAARGLALRNVLLDSGGQVARDLGHRALPTTVFFDAEGRVTDTRIGELSAAALAARLPAPAPAPAAAP